VKTNKQIERSKLLWPITAQGVVEQAEQNGEYPSEVTEDAP